VTFIDLADIVSISAGVSQSSTGITLSSTLTGVYVCSFPDAQFGDLRLRQ
jgi:hypothetical protein